MSAPLFYWVNAFTEKAFSGNAAAVVLHTDMIPEAEMQALAAEFNLSETAFVMPQAQAFQLRWFTPTVEVPLCGHGTLAAAVAMEAAGWVKKNDRIEFQTLSGALGAQLNSKGRVSLDFPLITIFDTPPDSDVLQKMFGHTALNQVMGKNGMLVVELALEEQVVNFQPDFDVIHALHATMLIITAAGKETDFVSRVFAPALGINEDPVTGAAHCVLGSYWAKKLDKHALTAQQLSKRTGKLDIDVRWDAQRVTLTGDGKIIVRGQLEK